MCRKCAEISPEEMRPYKRGFQYQGCKLQSLLNSRGFQTINLYIYIYSYIPSHIEMNASNLWQATNNTHVA